jgi:hypothetical protein
MTESPTNKRAPFCVANLRKNDLSGVLVGSSKPLTDRTKFFLSLNGISAAEQNPDFDGHVFPALHRIGGSCIDTDDSQCFIIESTESKLVFLTMHMSKELYHFVK